MKAVLNIICKSSSNDYFKAQIFLFIQYCYAELIYINEEKYWKDEHCVHLYADLLFNNCTSEIIKKAVSQFFVKPEDVIYTETQESIEINAYASIPEILQYNKVFLTLYIAENGTASRN